MIDRPPRRRFRKHATPLADVLTLALDHPAVVEGRTLFPKSVLKPTGNEFLLKSGDLSRKFGDRIVKGKWRGFALYSLSLEERKTCPRTCQRWQDCYGGKMPFADRFEAGPALIENLAIELELLSLKHRNGFSVRLHNLGDFYSVAYVRQWLKWLDQFPPLRVFGYTHHKPSSPIGKVLDHASRTQWNRFAMRFSDSAGSDRRANTIFEIARGRTEAGIVCPAQTGDSDCCASCALCWQSTTNIAFLAH